MTKRTRYIFKDIFDSIQVSDWDKTLTVDDDLEFSIANPYSKVSCFIVHLYSMELGNPPLYSEANRVARDMDLRYLKELGPFMRALKIISTSAE